MFPEFPNDPTALPRMYEESGMNEPDEDAVKLLRELKSLFPESITFELIPSEFGIGDACDNAFVYDWLWSMTMSSARNPDDMRRNSKAAVPHFTAVCLKAHFICPILRSVDE